MNSDGTGDMLESENHPKSHQSHFGLPPFRPSPHIQARTCTHKVMVSYSTHLQTRFFPRLHFVVESLRCQEMQVYVTVSLDAAAFLYFTTSLWIDHNVAFNFCNKKIQKKKKTNEPNKKNAAVSISVHLYTLF